MVVLAAVFAGLTVFLVTAALGAPGVGTPERIVVALVAVPFAGAAYLLWYQASGRVRSRTRRRAERGGAGGIGPGSDRDPAAGQGPGDGRASDEPTAAEAYRTLGLEPGADADAVRAAYRDRVRETHPDQGGDEDVFREVTAAYERLTGDQ